MLNWKALQLCLLEYDYIPLYIYIYIYKYPMISHDIHVFFMFSQSEIQAVSRFAPHLRQNTASGMKTFPWVPAAPLKFAGPKPSGMIHDSYNMTNVVDPTPRTYHLGMVYRTNLW